MMSEITFYGSSDDLVEVDGPAWFDGEVKPSGEEFDVGTAGIGNSASIRAKFFLMDAEYIKHMVIYALYDGCWSFAVGMVDEEHPLREWPPVVQNSHTTYSTRLTITVPDGVFAIRDEDAGEEMAAVAMLREKGYDVAKP